MDEDHMEVLRETGEFLKDNAEDNVGTFKANSRIKELSSSSVFNPEEIVYLRYRKDLIKDMYDSKVASGIIYYLGKMSQVFYIRALATKLGTYDRNVRTWVNKLYKEGSREESLLWLHPRTNHSDDQVVYYKIDDNKTDLFRAIFEGLIRTRGLKELKEFVSHTQSKSEVAYRKHYYSKNREERRRDYS